MDPGNGKAVLPPYSGGGRALRDVDPLGGEMLYLPNAAGSVSHAAPQPIGLNNVQLPLLPSFINI